MGRTLYLECYSGISGDMTVAALLDLGADQKVLEKALSSIRADGFRTEITRVKKTGLDACDFSVILDKNHENHDHDMEYLHGYSREQAHHSHTDEYTHIHDCTENDHVHFYIEESDNGEEPSHVEGAHHGKELSYTEGAHHGEKSSYTEGAYHGKELPHTEEPAHEKEHFHTEEPDYEQRPFHIGESGHAHVHTHEHRGMKEIREILLNAEMTEQAKDTALHIFQILAKAEAKAHGVSEEQVHFHEVGAVDSIVDIVATAVCLDNLNITEVIVPKLCEGTGFVRCQHGMLPVPVPAVVNIVQQNQLALKITDVEGELVTPTGAAIAAAIRTSDRLPEKFTVDRTGIGAGKRKYACPGILRAMLITAEEKKEDTVQKDVIWKLETNVDDCTGEELGNVMNLLFGAGARDVYYIPAYMKKNRPAWILSVLCTEEDIAVLEEILFRQTTTIGIRRCQMERTVLKREIQKLSMPDGMATVKICTLPDGSRRCYPEYESVTVFAAENHISYREAWERIRNYWIKERRGIR